MGRTQTLSGRTALITGGARRIGRATALALAREGVHVVIHCNRSREDAETAAEAVRRRRVKAWVISADLGDPEGAGKLFAQVRKAAGPIDFLINNASIFEAGKLAELAIDDLARNIQVNAFAPLQLARALVAQNRPGAIVNLLDARVLIHNRHHVAYHLSKRMLLSLTKMMALQFAPAMRVNGVAPGLILPPPDRDPEGFERLASTNPLKRVGSPEDIAEAVLFLLKNDFVTGQVLYIDGGYHLKGRTHE